MSNLEDNEAEFQQSSYGMIPTRTYSRSKNSKGLKRHLDPYTNRFSRKSVDNETGSGPAASPTTWLSQPTTEHTQLTSSYPVPFKRVN